VHPNALGREGVVCGRKAPQGKTTTRKNSRSFGRGESSRGKDFGGKGGENIKADSRRVKKDTEKRGKRR